MQFILGEKMAGCFLCAALAEAPSEGNLVLAHTEHALVIMNRYPYITGHLMVTPRRHVSKLADLSEVEMAGLQRAVSGTVSVLERAATPHGFNIGMNLGKAAGAGVEDHIHYHVVPRYYGDNNSMNIFAEVRVIPEDLIITWRRLRPFFDGMS